MLHANPLVNAFSAGIMKKGEMISATSSGVANPIFIVGSRTGKYCIHGALLPQKIYEDSAEDLPAVQVESISRKILLEKNRVGKKQMQLLEQDMGAAELHVQPMR